MTGVNPLGIVLEDLELVTTDIAPVEELRGETILITGGTGFIGTWLTELMAFLNDRCGFGTNIILLARSFHRFLAETPHLASRQDVLLLQADVRRVMHLPDEVGWIIHAAGSPDNRLHLSDPLQVMQVIANGTASVLDAATRLPNLKRFLNVSSGLVYGPQPWECPGIGEDDFVGLNCCSLSAVYPEAKRFAETLCVAYRTTHRLPIVNARPFAFIGPHQLLDRPWAVNNFIRDALLGAPIRILGDGQTVRSYMYGSDMAWWLLCILVKGVVGLSYNVGSPNGISLGQLAILIADSLLVQPQVQSVVSSDLHLRRSQLVPDVQLARNTLQLKQTVELRTAIRRTILWHQLSGTNRKIGS